jgi:hypothetical protein
MQQKEDKNLQAQSNPTNYHKQRLFDYDFCIVSATPFEGCSKRRLYSESKIYFLFTFPFNPSEDDLNKKNTNKCDIYYLWMKKSEQKYCYFFWRARARKKSLKMFFQIFNTENKSDKKIFETLPK